MRLRLFLFVGFAIGLATLGFASSKISDESYGLVRQLVAYKNGEIEGLRAMNQFALDCYNVSDEQLAAKKCSDRLTAMQDEERALQVKHDVLGHEIAAHIKKHKDEEWLFIGLMIDDKEFSNLAH